MGGGLREESCGRRPAGGGLREEGAGSSNQCVVGCVGDPGQPPTHATRSARKPSLSWTVRIRGKKLMETYSTEKFPLPSGKSPIRIFPNNAKGGGHQETMLLRFT